MQENNSCGKLIYMCDVQGPEKVTDICMKTMHAGTMDRGFTVLHHAAQLTVNSLLIKLKENSCMACGIKFCSKMIKVLERK
jgi:hypothetical protein